ncbi:MAG: type sorting protein [Segetibacter sp.]|nr:type sorting protein [Segetibacter sp.]
MKKSILITILALIAVAGKPQVTLLKANKSLESGFVQLNGKALLISDIDSSLWTTDGTPGGTIQLSATIKAVGGGAKLNEKFIFAGTSAATGEELFITDGTIVGTHIVKDIFGGTTGSAPDEDFAVLNGFVYFTAANAANGRELWKTDGTDGGTSIVKDIIDGPANSNDPDNYELFSNGSYLLFNAKTASSGVELYKSDGTEGGTNVLKDINSGAPSSDAGSFYAYNNIVIFIANTAGQGKELWKTDGTTDGTAIVKDIRSGTDSSISLGLFYPFNGQLLFNANNGTNGDELWITDGTLGNTHMVKDINPGGGGSSASLFSIIKVGTKVILTASNSSISFGNVDIPINSELWESDGTEEGTKIFKEIVDGSQGSFPFIWAAYDFTSGSFNTPLFQGNKFFFMAKTADKGYELWISDGTSTGTHIVKDINPDNADAITNPSYIYTKTGVYFAADNGVNGNEIWKSDGTAEGTVMVADINPGDDPENSSSDMQLPFFLNDKIIFSANNGDDINDNLYRLDGTFSPLPVTLSEFTVSSKNADAIVQWTTSTEVNTKDFAIQRSDDGVHFETIGAVEALGTSTGKHLYRFNDVGICNNGKEVAYYRLIMNDKDGKSNFSKVISLKLKGTGEWTVKLVKNPVVAEINLVLTGVTEQVKVSVRDISGRPVNIKAVIAGSGQVNLSAVNLMPGFYVLVAETSKDKKVIKFIKQ